MIHTKEIKEQELYVDLDAVARNLLLVALTVPHRPFALVVRQFFETMAIQHTLDNPRRYFHVVVALQVPGYAQLAKMVMLSQVENFLFDASSYPDFRIFRAGFAVDKSHFSFRHIGTFPLVVIFPGCTEMATWFRDVPQLPCMIEDLEFSANV